MQGLCQLFEKGKSAFAPGIKCVYFSVLLKITCSMCTLDLHLIDHTSGIPNRGYQGDRLI
jgi:hypothetical protein